MEVIEVRQSGRMKEGVVLHAAVKRKWVLSDVNSDELCKFSRRVLREGYIFSDLKGEVCVRSSFYEGGTEFTLILRDSGDRTHFEAEDKISSGTFSALWHRCRGSFEKLRFQHPSGVMIDAFLDPRLQGLVVAEMEFASLEEAKSFLFLTEVALRWTDVTTLSVFEGKNLALEGIPSNYFLYLNNKTELRALFALPTV